MADPKARVVLEAVRRGDRAFASFQRDIADIGRKAAVVAAAAGAALAIITKRSYENIDSLAKTADAIGITTEKLAGLQLAAQITGVDQEKFNKALLKQQKTIYDAQQGLSTATDALDLLGIKTEDLLNLSADEQFVKIAGALDKVENATIRSGIAASIYGARNVGVLKTLELGEDGLRRYAEQAENVGIAINRIDAAKVEQANDAVTLAKRTMEGMANIIAVETAPIVQALATAFVDSASDADAMSEHVRNAIDDIARAAGVVGDAFYGWQLIFKIVDRAALELSASIVSAFEKTNSVFADALKIVAVFEPTMRAQVALFEAAANVGLSDELKAAADEADRAYEALLAGQKPSERIAEALAAARAEAQRTAEETARIAAEKTGSAGGGAPETEDERQAREAAAKEAERLKQQLEQQVETVRQYTLSRRDVEVEAIQNRLEILARARDDDLISQDRFYELSLEVAKRGQQSLTEIAIAGMTEREQFEAMSAQERVQYALGWLEQMTAGTAASSKALFEINKAAAIAGAIVDAKESIVGAYKVGAKLGGPFLGGVFAAAAAAATAAQIQAIKSTSFGGGTTPSLAGTTGTVAGQPVQQLQQSTAPAPDKSRSTPTININIAGSLVGLDGGDLADRLAVLLRDLVGNNDVEIIPPDSLNAQRIRGL